jgi:ribosomal protein S18 acetylase RimI-like enzyme
MRIRKAVDTDLEEIVELGLDVHRMHVNKFPGEFKKPSKKNMRLFYFSILEDEDQEILLCTDRDKIIGYVLAKFVKPGENQFQRSADFIYIDQISVNKEHRRKGVGSKLVSAVKKMGRQKGIKHFKLDVWKFNKRARDFFESQGFSAQITRMTMSSSK